MAVVICRSFVYRLRLCVYGGVEVGAVSVPLKPSTKGAPRLDKYMARLG